MPARGSKRQGVSAAVAGGLVVLLLSLIAVAALGLAGFLGFRAALVGLSEKEIPRIIQASRLSESTNKLISETERLAAADSDANRRIAFSAVRAQLDGIAALLETEELSQTRQNVALRALEGNLADLDSLVASRIEVLRRVDLARAALLSYPATAVRLASDSGGAPAWLDKAMEIVALAGEASVQTNLGQIGQSEIALRRELGAFAELSAKVPSGRERRTVAFASELETTLLGEDGMMALLRERSDISREAAGKSNFARGLVNGFRTASAEMFNELVAAAGENTLALSRTVNRAIAAFVAAVLAASIAFGVVTLRLRRKLVLRLVNLNAAILRQVAGGEVSLSAEGDDEIADMTRSFLYYADEVAKREEALKKLARTDALTGISNRRYFLESAVNELERAERYGRPTTMLMLDIDRFKEINDAHGHPVGDVVLKAMVEACRGRIRKFDLFGRIGGDEFAVLMPETDLSLGSDIAERIREAVETATGELGDPSLGCTVSIGVAAADGPSSVDDLMSAADATMYAAKRAGRNCVRTEA